MMVVLWTAVAFSLILCGSLTTGQDLSFGGGGNTNFKAKQATLFGIPLGDLKVSSAGFGNVQGTGTGADIFGVHKAAGVADLTPAERQQQQALQQQRGQDFAQQTGKIQQQFTGFGGSIGGMPPLAGFATMPGLGPMPGFGPQFTAPGANSISGSTGGTLGFSTVLGG